jgi:hypothetical protein
MKAKPNNEPDDESRGEKRVRAFVRREIKRQKLAARYRDSNNLGWLRLAAAVLKI